MNHRDVARPLSLPGEEAVSAVNHGHDGVSRKCLTGQPSAAIGAVCPLPGDHTQDVAVLVGKIRAINPVQSHPAIMNAAS